MYNSIPLPRELFQDSVWLSLSSDDRLVFFVIFGLACWKSQKFNDHGRLLDLQPGDFCGSREEIAKLCGKGFEGQKGIKKIENSINRLKKVLFLGYKLGYRKSILSITHPICCKSFKNENGLENGLSMGQEWVTKEERKEGKKNKNINNKSAKIEPISEHNEHNQTSENFICPDMASPVRTDVYFCFSSFEFKNITQEDISCWKEAYPCAVVETELAAMREWCKSNPSKGKKNWRRFITTWLKKNHDHAENKQAYRQANAVSQTNPSRAILGGKRLEEYDNKF